MTWMYQAALANPMQTPRLIAHIHCASCEHEFTLERRLADCTVDALKVVAGCRMEQLVAISSKVRIAAECELDRIGEGDFGHAACPKCGQYQGWMRNSLDRHLTLRWIAPVAAIELGLLLGLWFLWQRSISTIAWLVATPIVLITAPGVLKQMVDHHLQRWTQKPKSYQDGPTALLAYPSELNGVIALVRARASELDVRESERVEEYGEAYGAAWMARLRTGRNSSHAQSRTRALKDTFYSRRRSYYRMSVLFSSLQILGHGVLAGAVVMFATWLVMLDALLGLLLPISIYPWKWWAALLVLISFPFMQMVTAFSLIRARSILPVPLTEEFADDFRKLASHQPILFLRSFSMDLDSLIAMRKRKTTPFWLSERCSGTTYEGRIAEALKPLGDLITAAPSGNSVEAYGAIRFAMPEIEWRSHILTLIRESKLIVIGFTSGENLEWELRQTLENRPLERIIICLPFFDIPDSEIREQWSHLARCVEACTHRQLPEHPCRALCLWFDESGEPRLQEPAPLPWPVSLFKYEHRYTSIDPTVSALEEVLATKARGFHPRYFHLTRFGTWTKRVVVAALLSYATLLALVGFGVLSSSQVQGWLLRLPSH